MKKHKGEQCMKYRNFLFLLTAIFMLLCVGCSDTVKKEDAPTTITVWHVYGGQTDSPLNDLIDEFNQTVGKEQRINVQVTSVSNTNTIHELSFGTAGPFHLLSQDGDGVAR